MIWTWQKVCRMAGRTTQSQQGTEQKKQIFASDCSTLAIMTAKKSILTHLCRFYRNLARISAVQWAPGMSRKPCSTASLLGPATSCGHQVVQSKSKTSYSRTGTSIANDDLCRNTKTTVPKSTTLLRPLQFDLTPFWCADFHLDA